MGLTIDLSGQVYGFWRVLEHVGTDACQNWLWRCRCVCGKEKVVGGQHLRYGASKSCGCRRYELAGFHASGANHHSWKGGAKNRGSIAWCNSKLDSLRQGRKRRGGAEIVSTAEDVQRLWNRCKGMCMACGRTPKSSKHLHLDHEYKSGIVRGFLCDTCNVAIGMAQDSAGVLRQCARYLDEFQSSDDYQVRAS